MFGYRQLFRAFGDVLAFGFVLTLLAAFGQTWFVGLFATEVRDTFGLSHGGFGALFSAATLTSGFLLIWLGGLIDRMHGGVGRMAEHADRFRAGALLPYYLLSLGVAGVLLGMLNHPLLAPIFFGLLGLSSGASQTVVGRQAELYGTAHLGAIRAMVQAVAVCASALTPGLMGVLLDVDVTIEAIGLASGLFVIAICLGNLRLVRAISPMR